MIAAAPEAWTSGLVFVSALALAVALEAVLYLRRPPNRKKNRR